MRALLLLLMTSSAFADDGLRCGDRLVSVGENEPSVAGKCGPPSASERRVEKWRCRGGNLRVTVDLWTYDRGPNEFVRTLRFEDGVLKNVEVGGYGG